MEVFEQDVRICVRYSTCWVMTRQVTPPSKPFRLAIYLTSSSVPRNRTHCGGCCVAIWRRISRTCVMSNMYSLVFMGSKDYAKATQRLVIYEWLQLIIQIEIVSE